MLTSPHIFSNKNANIGWEKKKGKIILREDWGWMNLFYIYKELLTLSPLEYAFAPLSFVSYSIPISPTTPNRFYFFSWLFSRIFLFLLNLNEHFFASSNLFIVHATSSAGSRQKIEDKKPVTQFLKASRSAINLNRNRFSPFSLIASYFPQ